MPIPVMCARGHVLLAKDKDAGTTVLCPRCQAATQVPSGRAVDRPVGEEAGTTADVQLVDTTDPKQAAQPGPNQVQLICANGHLLLVRDHLVGQYVACPRCRSLQLVPAVEVAAQVAREPAEKADLVPLEEEPAMVELIEDEADGVRLLPEEGQISLVCLFGHQLFVPEGMAGQQVTCPQCNSPVEVPVLKTSVPPALEIPSAELVEAELVEVDEVEIVEDEPKPLPATGIVNQPGRVQQPQAPPPEPRPRKKKRRPPEVVRPKRVQGLEKVNIGLGFHYARVALMLLGMLLLLLANGLTPFVLTAQGLGGVITVMALLAAITYLVAPLLSIAGSVLCLWTPQESGARWMMFASLGIDLFGLPLTLLFQILAWAGLGGVTLRLVAPLPVMIAGVASWVFFMLYLKQIALYVEEEVLAEEAGNIIIYGLIVFVIALLAIIVLGIIMYAVFWCLALFFAVPLLFAGLFTGLKLLSRQLELIGSLRQVIFSRWSPG